MSRYETIKEAAEAWVHEFNAIPQGMIKKLMNFEPDEWREITAPAKYDKVYVYDYSTSGEITAYNEETEDYIIELDRGETVTAAAADFEVEHYNTLPMWGTMWSFGDSADDYWLEDEENIRLMSECGFRIYESEEFGIFFGIDGAGYDFYESHWIPLYKARGLHWHRTAEEE